MKKLSKILLIVAALTLSTTGFANKADDLYKKVLPDLETNDLGSITMSIFCMNTMRK